VLVPELLECEPVEDEVEDEVEVEPLVAVEPPVVVLTVAVVEPAVELEWLPEEDVVPVVVVADVEPVLAAEVPVVEVAVEVVLLDPEQPSATAESRTIRPERRRGLVIFKVPGSQPTQGGE
jgi:hypothetical protein